MGATTSTMENHIESSVGQLFGDNMYREENMPTEICQTAIHGRPEEICLTIVDSTPDHHFQQHIIDDYNNYDLEKDAGQKDDIKEYQILYKAALKGDWPTAKRILMADPDPKAISAKITAKITMNKETVLHVAAASRHSMFVEKLLKHMPYSAGDFELPNAGEETMLHAVAAAGIIGAAKAMVKKNPKFTQIRDKYLWVPLVTAVYNANSLDEKSVKMVRYLCSVTTDEDPSPYSNHNKGGALICITVASNLFDIALDLVKNYPNLATATDKYGRSALEVMAERPSSFSSCSEATTWERFLRSFCVRDEEEHLKHTQALDLVKCICKKISLNSSDYIYKFFEESRILEEATKFGAFDIVLECVQTFPDLLYVKMKNCGSTEGRKKKTAKMTILEAAIKYRRENMFNLICELNAGKKLAAMYINNDNNTILHLVAMRADQQQLNLVIGEALQMQRQLQWYQEVDKIVLQRHRLKRNNKAKIARALFTEEHKDLSEKAEKWMKHTANSCMLVATLITTVVFAAAFTVPGGTVNEITSSDNGVHVFLNTTSFTVFAIADAIALFSSVTSVLIFFSILSSRYAEEDFLYSLPKKVILGFTTLCFSIAAMIIAFGATLSIVLQRRWAWAPIPIALFTCIPVMLFAIFQLPSFVAMVRSTYGPSIFRRKNRRMQWTY